MVRKRSKNKEEIKVGSTVEYKDRYWTYTGNKGRFCCLKILGDEVPLFSEGKYVTEAMAHKHNLKLIQSA